MGYRAVFLRTIGGSEEPAFAFARDLRASTIQTAIDEARAALHGADVLSIDIFQGDDKVETIGVGEDPART